MPILFIPAPEQIPVAPDTRDFTPLTHRWEAWDGTIWDLSSGLSGVYLRAGVRGLTMPPMIRYTQKSPAVAGSWWRGSIADERPVFWPVKVYEDAGSQAWIDHNRRFWNTLHPERTGTWIVTQPGGESRSLTVRFDDDGQFAWGDADPDPEIMGFANYGISLVAERPFWRGSTETIAWTGEAASNFLTATAGNVVTISSNSSVYGAQIANPGSLDAWPVWTIYGPCTTATVGVGDQSITVPITLTAGQHVTIDTDPTEQVAVNHAGVDVTAQLGAVEFAPIPPSDLASLVVSMTGTGSVVVSLTANYYTAVAN